MYIKGFPNVPGGGYGPYRPYRTPGGYVREQFLTYPPPGTRLSGTYRTPPPEFGSMSSHGVTSAGAINQRVYPCHSADLLFLSIEPGREEFCLVCSPDLVSASTISPLTSFDDQ